MFCVNKSGVLWKDMPSATTDGVCIVASCHHELHPGRALDFGSNEEVCRRGSRRVVVDKAVRTRSGDNNTIVSIMVRRRGVAAEHPLDVMTETHPIAEQMESNEEEDGEYQNNND